MLDIGSSELLMIVIVAVVVIGPKDLPRVLYKIGQVVGKARAMSRHFRSGIDAMIREVEMEEMERKWAEDNRRIMAQSPAAEAPAALPGAETGADVPALVDAGAAEAPAQPSEGAVPDHVPDRAPEQPQATQSEAGNEAADETPAGKTA